MDEPELTDTPPVELTVSIPADPSAGDAELLPPPLTAEETRALRASFSWESMTPLRELDSAGRPILHYALVYVTSRDAHESLAQLDLHHSYLPLFESERARWNGMTGIFTHEGDGVGVFAFAFLPAALINEERRLALAGEPAFDAIVVREVPDAAARGADGGVSYDWLRGEHFLYNGRAYVPRATGDDEVGGAREALLGGAGNRLATAVANAGEAAVEAVRRAIGAIDRWWNGGATINVLVTPLNTDPSFVAGSAMVQGWGANRGGRLFIAGQPVHVSQGVSLFVAETSAAGQASLRVVKDEHATVCVESEAPAAYITRFLVPSSMCNMAVTPRATHGMFVAVQIRAIEMNVLAQLDDANDYVRLVHGYTVHQPKVAVGGAADVVTAFNGGRAFAPCFNLPLIPPLDVLPALVDAIAFHVDPAVGLPPGTTSTALEFLLAYDILIPTNDSDRSRGVPTHEYGHFVLCDMLNEESQYGDVWIPMIFEGLTQGRGDTASQLNEAFADFISSQVTGSVNAFQTSAGPPPSGRIDLSLRQQWWCDPLSSVCVDDNIGGAAASPTLPLGQVATTADITAGSGLDPLFVQRTARIMTTIADAFDGQQSAGDVPGNGAAWTFVTPNFVRPVADSRALADESVTLGAAAGYRGHGFGLRQVVRAFADTSGGLLDVQFFRGMTTVMRNASFNDSEICELYTLHDPAGTCPAVFFETPPDLVPSAPVDLTHVLVAPNTATWSWRDISPLPGLNFELQAVTESSPSNPVPAGRLVVPLTTWPYGTTQMFGPQSLLPFYDTPIAFSVRTISTSGRPSAWTQDRLWTLAEPARLPRATGTSAGFVPLAWDPVIASSYGVVVTDASGHREEVARVRSPRYTYEMFDGGTITIEIVSYNHEGVPSAASPPLTLTRAPAPVLHVAPGGDDTADGGPTTPVGTIEAALALAGAFEVVTIRVAGVLPYTHTTGALSIPPGAFVRVEGGDVAADWSRVGKLTLVVTSAEPRTGSRLRGCAAAELVPDGDWAFGVRVGAGARLTLDQIALTTIPAEGRCTAALALESASLDLLNSEVAVAVQPLSNGECAVGVLGDHTSPAALTLTARSSAIQGVTDIDLGNAPTQVAAVCMHSADFVRIEDSTLTGGSGAATLLRARSASGLVLTQGYFVDVVRSTVTSVTPGPLGIEGVQTGVLLDRMLGSARIANSVVRTTRGSESNVAIAAHSLGGTGSLSLFYVTALAGNDYDRTESLPSIHRSAPVALAGALGSVRILNSVLANGAGRGDNVEQVVIAGIDRSVERMAADPRTFELRGTAISFPHIHPMQSEALAFCRPDDERYLGGIYDEATLNSDNHRCYPIAGGSSYTASANLAFNGRPDIIPSALTRPALRFDGLGFPLPSAVPAPNDTVARDAISVVGVDLSAEPPEVQSMLTVDVEGTVRRVAPPGAGAWVLPLPLPATP